MFIQIIRRNPPAAFPVWEGSFPQVGLQGMSRYINCRLLEQNTLCKSVEMHCPFSKHMAVRQLLPESRYRLMQAPIGMPQSQQTVVGRPIKWAQCGCFFPFFRCKPFLRRYDHFQSSASGSQWLETSHHVWFNKP